MITFISKFTNVFDSFCLTVIKKLSIFQYLLIKKIVEWLPYVKDPFATGRLNSCYIKRSVDLIPFNYLTSVCLLYKIQEIFKYLVLLLSFIISCSRLMWIRKVVRVYIDCFMWRKNWVWKTICINMECFWDFN